VFLWNGDAHVARSYGKLRTSCSASDGLRLSGYGLVRALAPAFELFYIELKAVVAQMVERVLGKDEVTGSIPVNGSRVLQVYAGATCSGVSPAAAAGFPAFLFQSRQS
jgi:hypothetical protein